MKIIRTIGWTVLVIALAIFSWANWKTRVEILIWENVNLETNVPALVIVAFLAGLLPVWLLYYGTRWRLKRRVNSLETAVRNAAVASASPPPDYPSMMPEEK